MATATSILARAARVINPAWLTGPIFEKELRVSSRRRRTYVLRFAYLALLAVFVLPVWIGSGSSSSTFTIARMADFGRAITLTVAWFQFLALPFVGVILCSTSISDEIYRRTLGVLMTTPINSFQIVMGKLLSRMFQLLVLLAISLPLLAVVRIFGGVPWDFLVTSLCITLTTVVFCGSISMYFSITNRHAYAAILKTFGVLALLFWIIPAILGLLAFQSRGTPEFLFNFLYYFNPGVAMTMTSASLSGGRGMFGFSFAWGGHCVVMLGLSAIVLMICVKRVRRAALSQVSGGDASGPSSIPPPGPPPLNGARLPLNRRPLPPPAPTDMGWRDRPVAPGEAVVISGDEVTVLPAAATAANHVPTYPAGVIRPVSDRPVIWKELRPPPPKRRIQGIVGWVVGLLALLILYSTCGANNLLGYPATQASLVGLLLLCGLVSTAVNAATVITTEREANSWPILLTTTLTNWDILFGKAVGVLRRTAAVWAVLLGHILIFSMAGYASDNGSSERYYNYGQHRFIPPGAVPWLIYEIVTVVFFLTCSGLFFSARMKRTSSAVVMNLMLGVGLWIVLPVATMMNGHSYGGFELYKLNPLVQAGGLIASEGSYKADAGDVTNWVIWSSVFYLMAGTLFFQSAAFSLRRRIF